MLGGLKGNSLMPRTDILSPRSFDSDINNGNYQDERFFVCSSESDISHLIR